MFKSVSSLTIVYSSLTSTLYTCLCIRRVDKLLILFILIWNHQSTCRRWLSAYQISPRDETLRYLYYKASCILVYTWKMDYYQIFVYCFFRTSAYHWIFVYKCIFDTTEIWSTPEFSSTTEFMSTEYNLWTYIPKPNLTKPNLT